jgi:glycerol-3-phosphate dehydrogenase
MGHKNYTTIGVAFDLNQDRVTRRQSHISYIKEKVWDYLVLGGGITGTQIYNRLKELGKEVLLVDAKDFASGTSSQSGMLIWGGMIYLKTGNLNSTLKLCRAREKMLSSDLKIAEPLPVRYIRAGKNPLISAAFFIYWILGNRRRLKPFFESHFPELSLFNNGTDLVSYYSEEGILKISDSQFVTHLLFSDSAAQISAINYLSLLSGEWNETENLWNLQFQDKVVNNQNSLIRLRTRNIINCTGPHTEIVNLKLDGFGKSPFKHIWSKGCYLRIKRPSDLKSMIVLDLPDGSDVITLCPFGESALFGPTETRISQLEEGYSANDQDLLWLKNTYEFFFNKKLRRDDILSIRAGVRPLGVPIHYNKIENPIKIARNWNFAKLENKNLWTIYGGKITDSQEMAANFCKNELKINLTKNSTPSFINHRKASALDKSDLTPQSSQEKEMCWFLEDYLRRRTDISQISFNGGFGLSFENRDKIKKIAFDLYRGDSVGAEKDFEKYHHDHLHLDLTLRRIFN